MAAEMTTSIAVRAESNTLLDFERRLREHLEERLLVRTRFAGLGATRAFLVSPADRDRPKSLVMNAGTSAAERVYLYVHVAAHIALGHNMPLVTIVEGDDGTDALKHGQAERLARAIWWRGADAEAVERWLPRVRTSRVLRALLSWRPTRWAVRSLLLAMRVAFYRVGLVRLLGDARVTGWLRQALCVAAVVSAAPQLVADPDRP